VRSRLRATPSYYATLAATIYVALFVSLWRGSTLWTAGWPWTHDLAWWPEWLWQPDLESAIVVTPILGVLWVVVSSARRLRRVATATILSVAESLGMTVVDAPEALCRPAQVRSEATGAAPP
jgi:hypothetical protein